MKYLKRYRLFESDEEKSYIDWNIIESAKDLSLEHLDDGLELEFNVDYHIDRNTLNILNGQYSHKNDVLNWGKKFIHIQAKDPNPNRGNIIYCFYFNKNGNCVEYADLSRDLNNTLRDMYPNLNIIDDRFEGYPNVQALRQYLVDSEGMVEGDIYSITKQDYKYYDLTDIYDYENMEFISCTEDVAFEIAKQHINNLMDEKLLNIDLYFRFDCVDEDSLVNDFIDEEYYRENWKDYGIKETEDGEMDEDNFEDFIQSEKEMIKDDVKSYLTMHFGEENIFNAIENYLKDDCLDRMTENIVKLDGLGHTIGTYDGKEYIEYYDGMEYSIFRLN